MSTTLLDKHTREPLFQQGEPYTLRQFIKIAKKSAEGKEAYKGTYNFGKGIKLAEYLRKNMPGGLANKMKATVYRSAWNYGENLTVTIKLKAGDKEIFSFSSANSTRQPTYSFSDIFKGTIKPSNPGKPIYKDWGMGVIHGSYQSISSFDEFMSDIIGVFKDFERVNGQPFDLKGAIAAEKIRVKAVAAWRKIEPKVEKQYDIAKEAARNAHRHITIRMPYIRSAEKRVYYKTDEPRELRHPDEYGDRAYDIIDGKDYAKYEAAQAKISDMIEAFCKKQGYEFVWAASW
mgnify:FL=1|tara:strand:+ start:131 stop:997 length:867 start_codon:yes stop_codon:yes gene_type:complete